MPEPSEVMTEEFVDKLTNLTDGSEDYLKVMGYKLVVLADVLGGHETRTVEIPLADAYINTLRAGVDTANRREFVRRLEVVPDDPNEPALTLEADHRGPEHGVDSVLHEPGGTTPIGSVLDLKLKSKA